jgi:hypothetical protein
MNMLGLNKLAAAIRTLSDNLTALAGTVAEVNQGVRGRLGLDHDDDHGSPALAGPEASGEPVGALPDPRKGGRRARAGAE